LNHKNLNNVQDKKETDIKSMKNQNSKSSGQLKQTKQSEYFKQIKPSSRVGKVKLPDIQEIDMKVLIELPEDIRNEILNEYKESNKTLEQNKINEQHINNENKNNSAAKTNKDISFSQIDPEFLAALPSEIKMEMKSYYDEQKARKIAQMKNNGTTNIAHKGWDMFKNEKKSNKHEKLKSGSLKINKASRKKKNYAPSSSKPKIIEIVSNKMTAQIPEQAPKANAINNSSYFHFSNGNLEHNKMLSNIVNCLLNLPMKQVTSICLLLYYYN
jgi:hypothetical protein